MTEISQPGARLPAPLDAWLTAQLGGPFAARQVMGGNRRQAWEVDSGGRALFLRFASNYAQGDDDVFTIRREAAIYRALGAAGLPIPRLVALHPSLEAMLVERAPGAAAYGKLKNSAQQNAIAQQYMAGLAQLHVLDARTLDLGLGQVRGVGDHIRDDIDLWERLYRAAAGADPLIEFALIWLRRNTPQDEAPARLVHGDAGPGNFLFQHGQLTAMLDWELCHLGDPMEDIAWVSMRSVLEPIPDFAAALGAYAQAAGAAIDIQRVRFHRVFVQWRIAIIRHRGGGGDLANSLVSHAINRRLLIDALADTGDFPRPGASPVALGAPTPNGAVIAYALDSLQRDIAPAVQDKRALAKLKSLARLLKHIERRDRIGPAVAQAQLAALGALLPAPPRDVDSGRRALADAIREGRAPTEAAFAYLTDEAQYDIALMGPALGALAGRSFPPLGAPQ